MDNSFTFPKIIKAIHNKSVGAVENTRTKRKWSPKNKIESTLNYLVWGHIDGMKCVLILEHYLGCASEILYIITIL